MNPHVSQKLFDELTAAEMAYRLRGIPVAEFLRYRANRHLGETRKQMLRVAALGDGANVWMTYFLEGFKE